MGADMSVAMLMAMFSLLVTTPEPAPPAASTVIVVRKSAARPAIERILNADNLQVESMPPSEVAERMEAIHRGAAPHDFWDAYQAHVQAWRAYADALDGARRRDPRDIDSAANGPAIVRARRQIGRSFDLVEKVARHYGVRVPKPRVR